MSSKKTQMKQKHQIMKFSIQLKKRIIFNSMNFYPIDFEEQASQCMLINEPFIEQTNESLYYEYDQSAYQEPEQLNTFDGYLQEEPVLLFNYVEEAPKKKTKHVTI